jgi:hypothetical protein
MKTTFEEKVRSMKNFEIIRAMTAGLRRRWVRLDMRTFGQFRKGVCYGCAATNAICEIEGRRITLRHAYAFDTTYLDIAKFTKADEIFVTRFEIALDDLRQGEIVGYNDYAKFVGFATIPVSLAGKLPLLDDDYTEEQLAKYDRLADKLEARAGKRRAV